MLTEVEIEKPELLQYVTMFPYYDDPPPPEWMMEQVTRDHVDRACAVWWPDTLRVMGVKTSTAWEPYSEQPDLRAMSVEFLGIKKAPPPPDCTCDCHLSRWLTESSGEDFLDGMALPL